MISCFPAAGGSASGASVKCGAGVFKMARIPRGFTLVELLVVITIIALLISLILPSLDSAKVQARRIQIQSNVRQMIIAVSAYAPDNRGMLPYRRLAAHQFPNTFVSHAPGLTQFKKSDLAVYNAMNEYGAMPSTAHPVMGTPAWDQSCVGQPTLPQTGANTGGLNTTDVTTGKTDWFPSGDSWLCSPYGLYFGSGDFRSSAISGSKFRAGSLRVDKSGSRTAMIGDILIGKDGNTGFNADTFGGYGYAHVKKGAATFAYNYATGSNQAYTLGRGPWTPGWGGSWESAAAGPNSFNPCDKLWVGNWKNCAGGVMGFYDGAVSWQDAPKQGFGKNNSNGQWNVSVDPPIDGWIWKAPWEWKWAYAAVGNF